MSGGRRRLVSTLRNPLLWFALMIAIFFYKEVFLGQVFSPADQLFVVNPWQAVKPASFTFPSNGLRSDESLINYPHRVDIAGDIKRYGLPLWQEHTLAGSANTFSLHALGGFAYPPFFAFLLFGAPVANTIVHVSLPLVGGWAMYLLLGMMVRHRVARLLGALAYALDGFMIVWLSAFGLSAIVALLPLGVYLAWRFLEHRGWLAGGLFAAVMGAVLIFSYPPGAIIYAFMVAVFALCWWGQGWRRRTSALAWLGVLGVLGVGLSMVAVLPTIQELTNYTSKPFRAPIVSGIPVRFLANWIFPNIAGNPVANDWRAAVGNYCEYVGYDGSLPLALSIGGGLLLVLKRLRASPLAVAALVAGVISFLLTYVDPVIRTVDAHPPFNNLNPGRWEFGIEFAIAVLAAYALDEVISRQGRRVAVFAVGVGAAAVVAAAGVLIWAKRHEFLHVDDFITQDYRLRLALLAAGLAALAWLVLGRRSQLAAIAAVAVVFLDLFSFGTSFNPAIPADQMYPETPALQYLQAHSSGYRVLPSGGPLTADDFNVYGIDVMTGYDHFRDDNYVALLGQNMSADEQAAWKSSGYLSLGNSLHLDDPVFNALSVKYAYFGTEAAAAPARAAVGWHQVYSGADGLVFENTAVLPKQYLVADGGGAPVPIAHRAARPDQDRLTVEGPGRLVWAKPYSRDWVVTINGRTAEPKPYMGYLLSVQLTAAGSEVSLAYQPQAYYTGAILSLVSAIVLLVLVVGALTWTRRRRQPAGAAPGPKGLG